MGSRPRSNQFPEPSRSRRRGDEACDPPESGITCGSNETILGHACSTAPPMKLEYTVQIWREDKQFVARAWPIDVASSGETPEAARLAVDEAVTTFVLAASDHGTLQDVLEESGYHLVLGEWKRPEWSSIEHRSVLVEV